MKYIFIPEKSVFSHAFDNKTEMHGSAKKFLDFCADQKSFKRYFIAIVPLSLMNELSNKKYFKNVRAYEVIMSFVDTDQSVCTANLDVDMFKLAEIKAIYLKPVIVANRENTFSAGHTTFVRNTDEIIEFMKDLDPNIDL